METIPERNADYKDVGYWDRRYETETSYEWLSGYSDVKDHIGPYLRRSGILVRVQSASTDRILVLGCGNSSFSEDLYDSGYTSITNLDYSATVIENMRLKDTSEKMRWMAGDMRDLSAFASGSFEVVLDKAGMDALVTDEGDPWDPCEETRRDVSRTCSEVSRLLVPGGHYLQISFQQPHFRVKNYLDRPEYNWKIAVETIVVGLGYYLYVMEKQ